MDKNFGQELYEIMGEERWKLLNDPPACSAFFQDKSSLPPGKIALLLAVLSSSIGSKLRETTWKKSIEITEAEIDRFIQETREPGYSADEFRWAIVTWAEALDVTAKFRTVRESPPVSKQLFLPSFMGWLKTLAAYFSKKLEYEKRTTKTGSTADSTIPASSAPAVDTAPAELSESNTDVMTTGANTIDPQTETTDTQDSNDEWWKRISEAEEVAKKQEESSVLCGTNQSIIPQLPPEQPPSRYTSKKEKNNTTILSHRMSMLFSQIRPLFTPRRTIFILALFVLILAGKWMMTKLNALTADRNLRTTISENSRERENNRPNAAVSAVETRRHPTKLTDETAVKTAGKNQPLSITNDNNGLTMAGQPAAEQSAPPSALARQEPGGKISETANNSNTTRPSDGDKVRSKATLDQSDRRGAESGESVHPISSQSAPGKPPANDLAISPVASRPAIDGQELPVPEKILIDLQQTTKTPALIQKLQQYKNRQLLGFGKKTTFGSSEGCYVFVCNPQHVIEIYQIINTRYRSLNKDTEYAEIGASLAADENEIWVQLAK